MYLRDGKVGQTFKEPKSGRFVTLFDINGGEATFSYTTGVEATGMGPVGEVFPMGDWEPVPIPVIPDSPWGQTQYVGGVAEGIYRIITASHGGLRLLQAAQDKLPPGVRQMFLNGPEWAEEDCEEIIVLALLGLTGKREILLALKMAQQIPRYQPAVAKLCELAGVEVVETPALNPLQGSYAHADGRTEYSD